MQSNPGSRWTRNFVVLPVSFGMMILCSISANAQQSVYWTNSIFGPANTGDWFTTANWTLSPPPFNYGGDAGVPATSPPTATQTAYVEDAPAATVAGAGAVANQLIITNSPPQPPPGAGFSGAIAAAADPGQVIVNGANASITLGGNNLASGEESLEISTGSLTVENGGTVNTQGVLIAGAGQLDIGTGGTAGTFNATAITNNGAINFNFTDSTTLSASISGTGTVTKLGAGTLTLSGDNTYSGGTTISGGTVIANSADALGSGPVVINNGATLDNFGTISASIASTAGGANLINESGGTITGNIALGNSANNVHLFTGSTINGNLNLGSSPGSSLILDGVGTATISQAVTGAITNAGSLTKQGSGTWTIDKALNAPVAVNINAGTLEVNSNLTTALVNVQAGAMLKGTGVIGGLVVNAGVLSPGDSPGILTINGNYTQTSTGTYNVLILSPTNFTQLVVTGHASLAGTLKLTLGSGYVPAAGTQFSILRAAGGISGTFQKFIGPAGQVFRVAYNNGTVQILAGSPTKIVPPEYHLSDGTPSSTTALMADSMFYDFGSLSDQMARSGKENSIGISFDAGTFTFEGHHGEEYGFPITGQFKLTDRTNLYYQIPLEYVEIANTGLFQSGLTLELPTKLFIATPDQHFSWDITPAAAVAAAGSREVIGAGAITDVFAFRFPAFTLTYGNYFSYFQGSVLSDNDQQFPIGVDQSIMKNGLKLTVPFGMGWVFECYGIYTEFLRTAPVSSYVTAGLELGRHFVWNVEGKDVDLGYLSFGLYTEQGNRYSSGHFRVGSAWRF